MGKEYRLTSAEKVSAYSAFSRRGLIKLCNEYDKSNHNKLLEFTHTKIANNEVPENTRIPEKIIDIGDGLIEVLEFAKEVDTVSKVASLVTEVETMIKSKKKVDDVEVISF